MADTAATTSGVALTALIAGAVAMVWTAYGLARVLRTVHALSWRCAMRRARHIWMLPVAVIAFAMCVSGLGRMLKFGRDHLGVFGLGLTIVSLIGFGLMWLVASMFLPRAQGTTWRDMVPGAVLVGLGAQGLHLATIGYFAAKINGLSERYGGLGVALGFPSWAYVVGWLFTMSAVLNAVIFEVRHGSGGGDDDGRLEHRGDITG